MSQSQRISRSSSEAAKDDEFLNTKLLEFSQNLATKKDMKEIKDHFTQLYSRLEYQERKIAQLEKEGADHEERIMLLENKIMFLENKTSQLNDKNAILSNSVEILKRQGDEQEQYSRRARLRIRGIEKAQDESASACVEKVVEIFNNLNLDTNISASDIDRAHRIGKDKKTMIVKFLSFRKRTAVYRARSSATNNIKIQLDLTKNVFNFWILLRSLLQMMVR